MTGRLHVSPRSGSRIFIVDDEPVIASSLAAILQMNGFSAKFFTCPLEALAAARSESPDLVISDVAMSGTCVLPAGLKVQSGEPPFPALASSRTVHPLLENSNRPLWCNR